MFSHYSSNPIKKLSKSFTAIQNNFKPQGFWISVDGSDDWREWCLTENFHPEKLIYRHELEINLEQVLYLKTIEDLKIFNKTYTKEDFDGFKVKYLRLEIDWELVKEKYTGIIIAPYQWELRLHPNFFWYYVWDCASGCIWDTSIIKITKIEELDGRHSTHSM